MLQSTRIFLGTEVDNSLLVLFRMIFGFLAAMESFGAIATGWVHETFIEPEFTFTMIGFEWLQPLEGNGMIIYFIIMGVASLFMMLGLFYRASAFVFFSMWTVVYIMQKSHYNNHYYLLVLLSAAMLFMPAHKSRSLDTYFGFTVSKDTCARACYYFFIIQLLIVYVYASIHKMNGDWIDARPLSIWFQYKSDYWLIGPWLQESWLQYAVAWGGVIYDGSIVFLLLHPKTRKFGFVLSIFFNLFNSAVFQIGIFPYLMIGFTVFFFPPETIRNIFFKKKAKGYTVSKKFSYAGMYLLAIYFLVQVLLPLRHHLFYGDVAFTEEGHRLSWRMMLRSKSGSIDFYVEDKEKRGVRERISVNDYLSPNQANSFYSKPDMIWQFAQRLKHEYAKNKKDVAVYADADIILNGHPSKPLIDTEVDLASVPWQRFSHSDWILTNNSYD